MAMILYQDNSICGLDFNLLGTLTASIDEYGVCLISDINTNNSSYYLKMDTQESNLLFFLLCYKNLFPLIIFFLLR